MVGKRQIARAAGVVVVFFVLSRFLGLVREMAIGSRFGTSGELDAYLAAFRLPDFIFQLIAGGALGSAFIPVFTAYLAEGDEEGAWRLASAVANLVLLALAALAGLAAWLAPWLVPSVIAPGFGPEKQALTVELMRWMLLCPVIFGLSGLAMAVLNSYQHFLLPSLAPVVYNLSIIGGALFLVPFWGVYGLVAGVVAGAVLHLAVQAPGLLSRGLVYSLRLGLGDLRVREVGRLMLPRALGLSVVQINFLVNTILASGLVEGSLAALNFAWLLMLLPQGVFAQAVATAAFPTFAWLSAKGEEAEMRETFSATLRTVLYLIIPASVGLFTLRYPLIRLLFQRGAFDAESTGAVAWALSFYLPGLWAHAALEIITRAFYARHDTLTPVLVGAGAMALNVILSLLLIGPLAHGGLAAANSSATILETSILLFILRKHLAGIGGEKLLPSLLRSAAAAGGMAVGLKIFLGWAGAGALLPGAGGIALGGAIYLAFSFLLGAEEPKAVWSLLAYHR
mgnify:CR=1 FL=1